MRFASAPADPEGVAKVHLDMTITVCELIRTMGVWLAKDVILEELERQDDLLQEII